MEGSHISPPAEFFMLMGVKRTGRWLWRPERVGLVADRRKTMWLELRWQQV
jgi:hypothetical protein